MDDLISRQVAIKAIKEDKIDLTNPNVVAVFKATGDFEKVETQVMTCNRHIKILKDLPSAQPESAKRTAEEAQNVSDSDLISRKAAIDEIDEWIKAFRENGHKESAADACLIQDGIIQLPSAQPEIVMCADCQKYIDYRCRDEHANLNDWRHEDDYCSFGKRRGR